MQLTSQGIVRQNYFRLLLLLLLLLLFIYLFISLIKIQVGLYKLNTCT